MAWFTRFTRFGDAHMVFGQEQDISCGVACVIMAAFKINKIKPKTKAMFSEEDIMKKAVALFGPNPLGTAGLNNPQIVQLLNEPSLNMTGWKLSTLAQNQVTNKILKAVGVESGIGPTVNVKPVIVGVDWKNGGGHWVVIDTVRKLGSSYYATVCDPWDASVHVIPVKKDENFNYTAKKVIDFDFFGKGVVTQPGDTSGKKRQRYEYETPSIGGAFLGDIICRK